MVRPQLCNRPLGALNRYWRTLVDRNLRKQILKAINFLLARVLPRYRMEEFALVNGEITFHNVRLIRRRVGNNEVARNNPGGGIGAEQPNIVVNRGGGIGAKQPNIQVNRGGGIGAEHRNIQVNPGGGIVAEQPNIQVNRGGGIGAEQPNIQVNPGGGIVAEQPNIQVNPGGGIGAKQPQPDVYVNTGSDEDDDGYFRHNDDFFFGHSPVHSENDEDVYIQTGKQSGPIETGKQTLSKTTGLNISENQSGPIETVKQTRLSKKTGLNISENQSGPIETGKQTRLSKTGKQPVRSGTGKQSEQRDDDVEEILGKKRSSLVHKEKKRKRAKTVGGESHREESVQDRLKVFNDEIEHNKKCMRNSDFLRFQVGINIVSAIIVDELPSSNHPITITNAERIYQDKAQVAFQKLGYEEWPNFEDVLAYLKDDKSPGSLVPAFSVGPSEGFHVVDKSWAEVLKNADFHRDESRRVDLEKSAFVNQLAGSI